MRTNPLQIAGVRQLVNGLPVACLALGASAQTITVDTTDDVVDFGGAQEVGNLPGPDGVVSFREACTAANNTAGPQTIEFAIPNVPAMQWSGGVALLQMNSGALFPLTDDGTTVDFTTQATFTGDTNPQGNEVGIWSGFLSAAPAISVSGSGSTVKGLDRVNQCGYAVRLSGSGNRVIACTITGPLYAAVHVTGTGNTVGGTLPGEGNRLSSGNDGVRIDYPASNNVVYGNVLSGTYNGATVRGSPFTGLAADNRIGGTGPGEPNLIAGAGKLSSEGFPTGAQVHLEYALRTVVEGNYIGTTADGTAPAPGQRGPVGVEVVASDETIVRDNVISGIRVVGSNHYAGQVFGVGVHVSAINNPTSKTTVVDNRIGTDPSGLLSVPNRAGVLVDPILGGTALSETSLTGNTIAFNELDGVVVARSVADVRLSGNSIHSNGGLGIDLLTQFGGSGVSANDPLDVDSGGNGQQNYPVLDVASSGGSGVQVTGALNSTPLTDFTIEVFASPACDPSGFGEGAVSLGTTSVTTDGAGDALIDVLFPAVLAPDWFASATATEEPVGATSEFSACVPIAGSGFVGYCTAGTSASGCQAQLAGSGAPSASAASGFSLQATNVEGSKDALFFYGTSGRQANPWGSGTSYQCVVPPVIRAGLLAGTGTNGACDGSFAQDMNALWQAKPAKNPGAGALVQAQLWYRDPLNTSNQTTSLSDALEFAVAP